MPVAFYVDMQMALSILRDFHPVFLETETMTIGLEPCRYVITTLAHELFFLLGKAEVFEICYLLFDERSEAFWIYGIVTVDKAVTHHGTGITVDNGTAHGELVKVGIGKMCDDWIHKTVSFFGTTPYLQRKWER